MLITLQRKIKSISLLDVLKIGIIIFVSFSLIANFFPYYKMTDSVIYGYTGISLTEGTYGITNELWEKTGDVLHLPKFYAISIYGTAIPFASSGMIGISALAYLFGGYYGLFYLGPIFTILLLIISERVATKWFGSFVGLLTLVFVSASAVIYYWGRALMTESIFSVFFILGCFYLIKFFHEKRERLILLSTIFFVASAFVRFIGMSIFPIEILFILGYFIALRYRKTKSELISSNKSPNTNLTLLIKHTFSQINSKKVLKISIIVLVPWLVYFSFWFNYNSYYYGDPFTNYYDQTNPSQPDLFSSFTTFDSERLEWLKYYFTTILPDEINPYSGKPDPSGNEFLSDNWQSVFSFFVIASALTIAMYCKTNRIEIIILSTFVFIFLLFYSSEYGRVINTDDRFMIPVLPFSFMLFSYIISKIGKINLRMVSKKPSNTSTKIFRITFFSVVAIFLFTSLWNSDAIEKPIRNNFYAPNPQIFLERYPIEKLATNSIIVVQRSQTIVEYEVSAFQPYQRSWFDSGYELNIEKVKEDRIQKLETFIEEGHEAFTFKINGNLRDVIFFRYLEAEQGIILKDYSNTFCKMVIVENEFVTDGKDLESDDDCYMHAGYKLIPKT